MRSTSVKRLELIRKVYPDWRPNSRHASDRQIDALYFKLLSSGKFNTEIDGQESLFEREEACKYEQLSLFA